MRDLFVIAGIQKNISRNSNIQPNVSHQSETSKQIQKKQKQMILTRQQNMVDGKTSDRYKNQSQLPQLTLKNTKIRLSLQLNNKTSSRVSTSIHVPQTIRLKLASTASEYKSENHTITQKLVSKQIQLTKVCILINQKCEILNIRELKLCQKVQTRRQAYTQLERFKTQNIISVHNAVSNLDTCTVAYIGGFVNLNEFNQLLKQANRLKDTVNQITQMVKQHKNSLNDIKTQQQIQEKPMQSKQMSQKQKVNQGKQNQVKQSKQADEFTQTHNSHKSTETFNVYFRINSLVICIGSFIRLYQPKKQSVTGSNTSIKLSQQPQHNESPNRSSNLRYHPTVMLQIETIKAIHSHKVRPTKQTKSNMKVILKSVCFVSPHDLSSSSILKAPVSIKLFMNMQADPKNSNVGDNKSKQDSASLGNQGGSVGLSGFSYGLQILDPLNLDIQQQHLFMLASIIKNIKPANLSKGTSQSSCTFVTFSNRTNQTVTMHYAALNEQDPKGQQSLIISKINKEKHKDREQEKGNNNNNSNDRQLQNSNGILVTQYQIKPHCSQQLYLFDLSIRLSINGQYSQTIVLTFPYSNQNHKSNYKQQVSQDSPTHQQNPKANKLGKSSLKMDPSQAIQQGNTVTQQSPKHKFMKQKPKSIQTPSDKSIRSNPQAHQPNQNSRNSKNPRNQLVVQKGIIFAYQDQIKYIMQIDYSNGYLHVSIKYKYHLHVFDGLQDYCKFRYMEIRCIKYNKYQHLGSKLQQHKSEQLYEEIKQTQYLSEHKSDQDIEGGHLQTHDMMLDWELLEEDKLDHLSFLLFTHKLSEFKIHRLMTNSLKYRIYGLYSASANNQPQPPTTPQKAQQASSLIDTGIKQLKQIYQYYILQQMNEQLMSSSLSLGPSQNQAHWDSNSHHYYLMPFLVIANNLQNHSITLNITNKKSSLNQYYHVKNNSYCIPTDPSFDYYMKQYMIKLQLEESVDANADVSTTKDSVKAKRVYESQEHYFNTFFMVDQSFENIIQLRASTNSYASSNSKRYVRLRESFIHKTKILVIQDCLNIQNKTDYNLEVGLLPQNIGMTNAFSKNVQKNVSNVQNQQKDINNCKLQLLPHSCTNYPMKFKKSDRLVVSYLVGKGIKQNSVDIQIPVSKIYENNNRLLLSYNFCKIQNKQKDNKQQQQSEQYYQILIKLQIKTISHNIQNLSYNSSNLQMQLILSPFIVFTNMCSKNRKVRINDTILSSSYDHVHNDSFISLALPSNTNKDYNNKYLPISCEQIYQDLLVSSRNWIMEGSNHYMQIQLLPLQAEQPKSNRKITHSLSSSQSQLSPSNIIYLNEIINQKIIQFNKVIYSLVKSFKQDSIELFFGDHLFPSNTTLKYYIFNNSTDQHFLMNSSQTQYAKYLLFPNSDYNESGVDKNVNIKNNLNSSSKVKGKGSIEGKDITDLNKLNYKKQADKTNSPQTSKKQQKGQNNVESKQTYQKKQQANAKLASSFQLPFSFNSTNMGSKVHIQGKSKYPLNMMLNKEKHDIFLCDSEYRKLEPLTLRKLQKLKIKQQKYQIQNFTIFDLQNQNNKQNNLVNNSTNMRNTENQYQYQFSTSTIIIKLSSKRKNLSLINQLKSVNVRHFQNDKTDVLIQDITVSVGVEQQKQQNQQKSTESNKQNQEDQSLSSSGNLSNQKKNRLQFHQILRIPQQSYLLIQGKSYQSKILLVKNIFLKCKIIDLHINKQLLAVASYFAKVGKYVGQFIQNNHNFMAELETKNLNKSFASYANIDRNQSKKIQRIAKQQILLIRSIYIHPINLCLTVQTNPTLDFSNMIILPEYVVSNKVFKIISISKQISNHYSANVIAKFPKLSFIYQNIIRSPILMIKSILETRTILMNNQKQQQRKRIYWNFCYVQLQKKYFGAAHLLSKVPRKKLINFISLNTKKTQVQLQQINLHLLKLTLDSNQDKANKQVFICQIKNVVSSNITKLSQMVNVPITYYLTNKNIRVITQNFAQYVSLKQIQSAKVVRYNKKNAELVIVFKRRGIFLKIVDEFLVCHSLMRNLNSVLI